MIGLSEYLIGQGFSGSTIDMLRDAYSQALGVDSSIYSTVELERLWLIQSTGETDDKSTVDLWRIYLEGLGYTGANADMFYQAIQDGTLLIGGFIISLLTASITRAKERSVSGYASGATIADGESLLTVPAGVIASEGGRLATTVADGAALGSDGWTEPPTTVQAGWVDNGDGTYTGTNASGSFFSDYPAYIGSTVLVSFNIDEITSGSAFADALINGPNETTTGAHSAELDVPGPGSGVGIGGSSFTGIVSNIKIEQVVPTWKTTGINGVALPNVRGLNVADATVNKCECVKANPTDLTGLTKLGDAAATLTVVDDTAELALAGLDELCTSGKVYKLDNSGGSGLAYVNVAGELGNTNGHIATAYMRGTGGVAVLNAALNEYTNASYSVLGEYEGSPSASTNTFIFFCLAGHTAYFILPGLYEAATVPASAPIIGADTAASASSDADIVTVPTSSVLTAASGRVRDKVVPDKTGQTGTLSALYTDGNNSLACTTTATEVLCTNRIAGVEVSATFSHTHTADVDLWFDFKWDAGKVYVKAATTEALLDAAAYAEGVITGVAALPVTMQWGQFNGASIFKGTFLDAANPVAFIE